MKIPYYPKESYDISLPKFASLKPYITLEQRQNDYKGFLVAVAKIVLSFLPEGYTFDTSYFREGVDCTSCSGLFRDIFVKSPEGKRYKMGFRATIENDTVYISVCPMFRFEDYKLLENEDASEFLPGELINALYAPTTLYDLEYSFRLYERYLAGEISEEDFKNQYKYAREEEM